MASEYIVHCWNCLGEFDAVSAVWCSCNPNRPTKVCPFCLTCFCNATADFQERFWANAPEDLKADKEMLASSRGPLGEALVKAKAITSDQLLAALKEQKKGKGRLGEVLVQMGFITQETLQYFLSRQKVVMHLSLAKTPPDPALIDAIGARECMERLVIPVNKESLSTKEILTLAMANPSDGDAIDFVQNLTGCQILPMRASEEEVRAALEPFVEREESAPAKEEPQPGSQIAVDLLRKALKRGASDLYLEPKEHEVTIHLRIDGSLYKARPIDKEVSGNLMAELKRMLRLDPEMTDKPQEGRVVMRSGEDHYDLIAQTLPTRFGENLSLKIINQGTFLKSFDQLGMEASEERSLRVALSARAGLILVTAPLFHGSTTTLYAIQKDLAVDGTRKVMSIEPQSICPVPNVSQVALGRIDGPEAAVTTLRALTSIQPDVCVLGEVLEAPQLASQVMKFATQMLLVATLEASSSVQSLRRLMDLGVSSEDLAKHIRLVVNQRLVRRICPDCCQETRLSQQTLQLMGLSPNEARDLSKVYQGEGCDACSNIGYRSRLALFELLNPSTEFRQALSIKAPPDALEREAIEGGLVPLRQKVLDAVGQGLTTLEEFQKGNFS